jgi:hypothetical protein
MALDQLNSEAIHSWKRVNPDRALAGPGRVKVITLGGSQEAIAVPNIKPAIHGQPGEKGDSDHRGGQIDGSRASDEAPKGREEMDGSQREDGYDHDLFHHEV